MDEEKERAKRIAERSVKILAEEMKSSLIALGWTPPDEENLRLELAFRLEQYARGCFSGNVSEWPQLKPLLKDIYNFLSEGSI